jgi:hypothetical protein
MKEAYAHGAGGSLERQRKRLVALEVSRRHVSHRDGNALRLYL